MAKILQWREPYNKFARQNEPVCCHDGADEHNIGYAKLVMPDGTPAEAELFRDGDRMTLSVIMPVFANSHQWVRAAKIHGSGGKQVGYFKQSQEKDYSILDIGMVDDGCENDIDVISEYVEYLADMNVIRWSGDVRDGSVSYLYDVEGHELATVKVTVEEYGRSICNVVPEFQKFAGEGL